MVGTGESLLDLWGEQLLPARLFLGVSGAQRFTAEQEGDHLKSSFCSGLDVLEHLEGRTQGVPDVFVCGGGGEARRDVLALFGQSTEREVLLALEVVEQCPSGDAGGGGDLLDGGLVVALLGEQGHRGLGDE